MKRHLSDQEYQDVLLQCVKCTTHCCKVVRDQILDYLTKRELYRWLALEPSLLMNAKNAYPEKKAVDLRVDKGKNQQKIRDTQKIGGGNNKNKGKMETKKKKKSESNVGGSGDDGDDDDKGVEEDGIAIDKEDGEEDDIDQGVEKEQRGDENESERLKKKKKKKNIAVSKTPRKRGRRKSVH